VSHGKQSIYSASLFPSGFVVIVSSVTDIAAIVLAAGRSERMGAFKPLLRFGETTVIESCLDNLRQGGVETIVVVLGHRGQELRDHLKTSGVLFAVNPDPDGEMSDSIASGLRELPLASKAVLITPADYPAAPAGVISQLIVEWKRGHLLVKPTWQERGGHPVLVDLSFRKQLLNLDSRLGMKALFDTHLDQVKRLPVNSNYVARDIDTWEDYAALHRDVFGVLPPSPGDR
jgi:CTP:molybdopterin cytidylyltransferase MocA